MAQQQNPKSLINQFYQRAKAEPPRYAFEAAPVDGQPNRFVCTLTLPTVTVEGETLPEQTFQEEGRSKKVAQDAAAAEAFRFLSEQPLYGNTKPYDESLLRTLATQVLSPQGLFRDPEIHGAAAAAATYLDGWLPLAALPHSRPLRGWAKEYGTSYGANVAADPAVLVEVVRRELAAQAAQAVAPEEAAADAMEGVVAEAEQEGRPQNSVATAARAEAAGAAAAATAALGPSLGPGGLCVRLAPEAVEAAPPSAIADQLDPEVVAAGQVATLVVIPADSSLPLREESIPARGFLLSGVAELLACPSPHHVLQWGRVGHKATFVADPRVARKGTDAASLAADPDTWAQAAAALSFAPGGSLTAAPRPAPAASGAGAVGGGEDESAAPAESEAASAPAPAPAGPAASSARGDLGRSHRPAVPSVSEQSISLPPAASACEVSGGGPLLEPRASAAAAAAAGDNARGSGCGAAAVAETSSGSGFGAPVRPPASLAAYRAESTLTLAVHRGPAAMDWEADGQNEVRGPEHPPSAAPGPAPGRNHHHHHYTARTHHGTGNQASGRQGPSAAEAAGPSAPPRVATRPAPGRGAGGGAVSAAPSSGASSPRHANIHPSLCSMPEPSLYSKLLLPPLPLPQRGAASEPLPLASMASATATGTTSAPPYSLAGEPLNIRATWLAGRPVYGDAVATTSRQSPIPHIRKNHHVMKWRNYSPHDFWRTATAATPAAAYTRAAHAPLLLQGLPSEYRGPSTWQGPNPRQLLDTYTAAHAPAAGYSLELRVPDVDLPGEGLAEVAGTNFLGLPYRVTAGPAPLDIAAQQAALAALLELQRLDAACLGGTWSAEQLAAGQQQPGDAALPAAGFSRGPEGAGPSASGGAEAGAGAGVAAEAEVAEVADVAGGAEVEVLEPGLAHARQPQDGALAKIAYTISLATDDGGSSEATGPPGAGLVLEQHPGLTICVGAAGAPAVPPGVDAAVRRLRVGGRARCRLSAALEGCDPLAAGFPGLSARVELRLLHASLPVVEGRPLVAGGGGPPLFTPPLGQQRMQAVAAVLWREHAATLVDLGCGDCKLLEGLLLGRHGADCGGPLRRAVGVDISGGALTGAARRLGKLTAAAAEVERMPLHGEESVPQPVVVELYRGSAMTPAAAQGPEAERSGAGTDSGTDPWVGLRCCDAATMVEVVEHLDPEPLALVGPCVLGGLRPRVLLVTTPNWEYNGVLRACELVAVEAAARRNKAGSTAPALTPGGAWPGPPGRDGLPLRCADHRFEWTRAEFRGWCEQLADQWGYSVSYEEIGRAIRECEALRVTGYGGPQEPGGATQMAVFRRKDQGDGTGTSSGLAAGEHQVAAAAAAAAAAAGGKEGSSGACGAIDWELVWGPSKVAAPREELEEAEVEAADGAAAGEAAGATAGAEGGGGRVRSTAVAKRGHNDDVAAPGGALPEDQRSPKRRVAVNARGAPAGRLDSRTTDAEECPVGGCGSVGVIAVEGEGGQNGLQGGSGRAADAQLEGREPEVDVF